MLKIYDNDYVKQVKKVYNIDREVKTIIIDEIIGEITTLNNYSYFNTLKDIVIAYDSYSFIKVYNNDTIIIKIKEV